ncbi:MAG: type II toxin-antitoxin system RelB/DinJ family antitoxin [Clostridiales bacterium]|nr:type II toxin-antitoxin system RelB/DinJ family antitoxin [Clostridiales bacterium]
MSKQSINFEVETALVNEVDVVLKELGISMPEAVTMYLEQIVNKHSISLHKDSYQDESIKTPEIWIDEAVEAYLKWF